MKRFAFFGRRPARAPALRPLALSLACAGLAPVALAQVLPTGLNAIAGGVTQSTVGGTMTIQQAAQRAIAQWQSFSIGAGGVVNVVQPSSSSVLLNRVVGNEASDIQGRLSANGHVYLINPNGLLFGPQSRVDVGGLIASTLDVSDANFLAGGALAFERAAGNLKAVINQGRITAADGGQVTLMGAVVRNEGEIQVARGSAGLVSARALSIDFDGDGLITYKIAADSKAASALVENTATGSVMADGGRVVLLANADAAQMVVNQAGLVRARTLESRHGEIILGGSGAGNEVRVTGQLDATGGAALGGGLVSVSGDRVRLEGAQVDASGRSGGAVGVSAGEALSISPATTVRADALGVEGATGKGGTVVALGGSFAHVGGTLSARGAGSGAGGQIVTGGGVLEVEAATVVDAGGGAAGGANGRWRALSGLDLAVDTGVPAYAANAYQDAGGTVSKSRVDAGVVGQALGRGTDVVLSSQAVVAEGRSTGVGVGFAAGVEVLKSAGGDATLRVDSAAGIVMATGSAIRASSGALNVEFNTDANRNALPDPAAPQLAVRNLNDASMAGIYMVGAAIESNGGDVRFFGQGDVHNGRAVGYSGLGGVSLANSRISTCAAGVASCSNGGSISLRGLGATDRLLDNVGVSGAGVSLVGSQLVSGSGAITLDGIGGIGSAGVRVAPVYDAGGNPQAESSIQSASGTVTLVGASRGWAAGDGALLVRGQPDAGPGLYGAGTGVAIGGARILTGGDIRIDGSGGDIAGLMATNAMGLAGGLEEAGVRVGATFSAGDGVRIERSEIAAGTGRTVTLSGSGGSTGFSVLNDGSDTPVITPEATGAMALRVVGEDGGRGVRAEGGRISLDGRLGDVAVLGRGTGATLSTASATGAGGEITVRGRNVWIDGVDGGLGRVDASGATQGGSIDVRAQAQADVAGSGVIALGDGARLQSDVLGASGNAGSVRVVAGRTLYGYGQVSARGGEQGGNGGIVETSGETFRLAGLRVDASAPRGQAGAWIIDPFNVTIVPGIGAGTLTGNPFVPLADSIIQDGDINAALNAGTSVTIGTGSGGVATDGDIVMDAGVNINYSADRGALTFQLDAHRSVRSDRNVVIQSTGPGALNVVFNTDVNGQGDATGGGQVSFSGDIYTNGGNVVMNGRWTAGDAGPAINLDGDVIDTRVGRSDASGLGGSVTLNGTTTFPGGGGFTTAAVNLLGVQVSTGSGRVDITGDSGSGTGVRLTSRFISTLEQQQTVIASTSGDIAIRGLGSFTPNSPETPGHGVVLNNATVRSVDGDVSIHGLRRPDAGGGGAGDGVLLRNAALVQTTGSGDIDIAGQSPGTGAGVRIAAAAGLQPAAAVAGARNVALRASNAGTADALVIGGTASAGQVLNLRPGGVAADGSAFEQAATPITLGGTAATGFAVSADEFTRLSAGTVVVGSAAHAGDIAVVGPLALASDLTLHNGAGGNIALGGAIATGRLGLVSAGDITQAAGATLTAGSLYARSAGGSVLLGGPGNNVGSVAGGAPGGRFEYLDSDALTLGGASAIGWDAGANLPALQSAPSMAAQTLLVRTLAGDLALATDVATTGGADLVAAARFQNPGGHALGGAPWRVWADTWAGETRGGLAGSGLLPNLYHCAYFGLCTVTVSPGDNHFIYAQQPTATVVIGNRARPFGALNPLFTYVVTGLILGDTGAGFSGTLSSPALPNSPPGYYPINGSFTSAEGYAVNVVPGLLQVRADTPQPDIVRQMPTTWLYDRNIAPAPMCFATGPLDGERAAQGGDLLAREWSKVRSRPNLTNCVDSERRNGCGDF